MIPNGNIRVHDECRAPFNHHWVDAGSGRDEYGFVLRMQCTKCLTTFKQFVRGDGSLVKGRNYKYQSTYRDAEHWSRSDWRANYLLRLMSKEKR
jgi:hypothetical protein